MFNKTVATSITLSFLLAAPVASEAQTGPRNDLTRTFPYLQCDRYGCNAVLQSTPQSATRGNTPAPTAMGSETVGAPAGQRFFWSKDDYSTCQMNFAGATPVAPFEYMAAYDLPVPLGSQHASLMTTFQMGLAGGPGGASSAGGMLQIRRSSGGTWVNADASYQITAMGAPAATYFPVFGRGMLSGVEDLALLPPAGSVPSMIDVRVVVFTVDASGYTQEYLQDVCYGNLSVTF